MVLDLITVPEAATLLGVVEKKVRQLIADGTLTSYLRGRLQLVDRFEAQRLHG